MTVNIAFLDSATIAPGVRLGRPNFAHKWRAYASTTSAQITHRLADCHIAIVNKVALREKDLRELPELKMIAVAATGTDNIDLSYCRERGIVVANIQNYAGISVPEHALSLIMALRRNIVAYHQDVRAGAWQRSGQFCFFGHPIDDLANSRLGIIGAGTLGQAMASLGRAIGMDVVTAARKQATDERRGRMHFDQVLASSDVVSLHCPLTADTQGIIGLDELRTMKDSALLINTARGGLVNEQDLVIALREGIIAGAGFDVLTEEPPTDGHALLELLDLPNFILTPHIAWASSTAMQTLADQLIENIDSYLAGEPKRVVSSP